MRIHLFFLFGLGLWLQLVGYSAQASVIDLGELTRQGAPTYPIAIRSEKKEVSQIAQAAFRLHGSYEIVSADQAVFHFDFEHPTDTSIDLVIRSGQPSVVQLRQTLTAHHLFQAALKACDLAVQKTLGIPGFFAGKIAFVSQKGHAKEIFTSDILFQHIKQLTHDQHHSVTPHWSPDGRYLTYTGYYLSEFPDLFLIDTATGKRKAIATYQGTNTGGVFSPSGQQLAMILSSSGNPELYIAGAQGQNPKRLTHEKSLEASPTWSPDGQKIAFTSDRLGGPQIFEMTLASRQVKRLPLNISGYCAEAAWNPKDAHQLACTAAVSKSFQIALYDFRQAKARFITQGPGDCLEACWLNDGRHLIFTRRQGQNKILVLLDTLTGKQVPLHGERLKNASQAAFVY